tara:strand:+ start:37 stop:180 length:144 start_codon:yes stop_codon:yes gene_type:complete
MTIKEILNDLMNMSVADVLKFILIIMGLLAITFVWFAFSLEMGGANV